ncbi:MAG: hypothetical protein WC364_07290 [Eubacteriales bacterium]|jgi:very-short-patch-repair endonuclease
MMVFQTKSEWKVGQAFKKQRVRVIYQYECGQYFLDLYLPDHFVSIEVHGPHHIIRERIKKDKIRSGFVKSKGINEFIITAQDANDPKKLEIFVREVLKTDPGKYLHKSYNSVPFNNQLAIQIQKISNCKISIDNTIYFFI